MPRVEAPFITAVIREKEKSAFSELHVSRILNAPNAQEMREVLMGTPYGIHLADGSSIPDGAEKHLEHEYSWLTEHLDSADVLAFISARYDALHIALGILARTQEETTMPHIPKLGMLSHAVLQEMIFDEVFAKEDIWSAIIKNQITATKNNSWTSSMLFEAMKTGLEEALASHAKTAFMKDITRVTKEHHESDSAIRESGEMPGDITAYELSWDTSVIERAKTFRYEPVGYDPIVAYWMLKELEVKNIRMLYAALSGGFSQEETRALIRQLA
ncbi:MAG: V-type ATPase subunit [Candidatus Andersenbacteria bacterium]